MEVFVTHTVSSIRFSIDVLQIQFVYFSVMPDYFTNLPLKLYLLDISFQLLDLVYRTV